MENKINNLILELNSSCNNSCVYCYIPEENRFEKSRGNKDYFKQELINFRNKDVKCVDFTGGEPTLYPYLFELVMFSKKLGYENRTLVTNGRLLAYKDYCSRVIKNGINKVILPLHGPNREIAEAITRSPGSFKQTISAIENIKNLGIELGITIVVNKLNYKYIPETMKRSLDFGTDFINIQFLLPYVKDKNVICRRIPSSIIPAYEDSTEYVKSGLDRYGNKIKIKVHFVPFCYMKGYERYLNEEAVKHDRQVVNYRGYSYNMGKHLQKGSIKTEKCRGCKFSDGCVGFFYSYAKEFGIAGLNGGRL